MENQAVNPLKKYFRQPKLYLKLPSSGSFYPEGTLEKTDNGEYPVFPMTAKDEITIKTPDALMNGQATVDVIESCIPNIKNAWAVPSIDIDAILIAIRIATYGETIELDVTLPNTTIIKTFTADLRLVVDKLMNAVFDTEIKISDDLTAFIRPLTYKEYTQNSIKTLEEQRLFSIVNNDQLSEEEKQKNFSVSFKKITDITVNTVAQSITKIVTPDGVVTDPQFIKEFLENSDKDFFNKFIVALADQKEKFIMPPFKVQTSEEEQKEGAPAEFEAPVVLDASNFFG
jgi:hypothetical protein